MYDIQSITNNILIGEYSFSDHAIIGERNDRIDPKAIDRVSLDGKVKKEYPEIKKDNILEYRLVTDEDINTLFKWVNDPLVRKNSFYNKKRIKYDEHKMWFRSRMKSGDCVIYIFLINSEPIGQVRFDKAAEFKSEINISVDSSFRDKGLSSVMINIASSKYRTISQAKTMIVAHIKLSNMKSLRAFQKAGFIMTKTCIFKNQQCYELIFN